MTKIYSSYVELYAGIIRDVQLLYPRDAESLGCDLVSLKQLVSSRGLSTFVLDLPALDRALLRGLDTGHLNLTDVPLSGRRSGTKVPKLFSALWLRVFTSSGVLREGPDIVSIQCLRQLLRCLSKKKEMCNDARLFAEVASFYQVDHSLPYPSPYWDQDEEASGVEHEDSDLRPHFLDAIRLRGDSQPTLPTLGGLTPQGEVGWTLLETTQHVADVISTVLGDFNPLEGSYRHGPGAVSDMKGESFKYDFPNWPAKLEAVFPYLDVGLSSYSPVIEEMVPHVSNHEAPSRLIPVPKTAKAPRLIAAEPTSHQWCQQSIRAFLAERVRGTFLGHSVDFVDQALQGELALLASKSGSHGTIDLSSASDRLSCYVVERVFRGNRSLLRALRASRTRYIFNGVDKKSPRFHKLRKFSSMGSAVTFPVQSLVFLTLALSAVCYTRKIRPSVEALTTLCRDQTVRVFGDDIIVVTEAVETLIRLLEALFLKVNANKSFWTGKFRESCGVDAYDGVDVTPVYASTSLAANPESVVAQIDIANNLFLGGWWWASDALLSPLPAEIVNNLRLVAADSGAFGLKTFCGTAQDHLKTRWNESLHRYEVLTYALTSRVRRTPRDGYGPLLQYFTEEPDPLLEWSSGSQGRPSAVLRRGWVPLLWST